MKINANELQAVEAMLGAYSEHHGDIAVKHDATNFGCDGGCYMSCKNGCSGGCQGSCSAWAR
ncbi:MAG: hypothetical protein IJQ34_06555 [Kiritimatiellae bacterium]|nr:hypothetical protein [Kiritimatiellia bacterium]